MRRIQASDLSQRIELGGPDDELRRLADTFDDMLGRVDEAFESQRQFIHEASHELRNPLAVIRTNLEVTLSDPAADADDLRHTAEVVERSTERMAKLVDDLLVYARKGTLSMEREPVDVGLLISDAADEFAADQQRLFLPELAQEPRRRHAELLLRAGADFDHGFAVAFSLATRSSRRFAAPAA